MIIEFGDDLMSFDIGETVTVHRNERWLSPRLSTTIASAPR
jgi:hypothetical protein